MVGVDVDVDPGGTVFVMVGVAVFVDVGVKEWVGVAVAVHVGEAVKVSVMVAVWVGVGETSNGTIAVGVLARVRSRDGVEGSSVDNVSPMILVVVYTTLDVGVGFSSPTFHEMT